jgi:pantothenate kinase
LEFPKLLGYYGSASITLLVNEDSSWYLVSQSMLAGGSLKGLASALTGVENFDEIVKLANEGSTRTVDQLFEDTLGPTLAPSLNGISLG